MTAIVIDMIETDQNSIEHALNRGLVYLGIKPDTFPTKSGKDAKIVIRKDNRIMQCYGILNTNLPKKKIGE